MTGSRPEMPGDWFPGPGRAGPGGDGGPHGPAPAARHHAMTPHDAPDPAAVLRALGGLLAARGHRHLYGAADARAGVAVLSVRGGTTVWIDTRARLLGWVEDSGWVQWPLADLEGAVVRLAAAPPGPAAR